MVPIFIVLYGGTILSSNVPSVLNAFALKFKNKQIFVAPAHIVGRKTHYASQNPNASVPVGTLFVIARVFHVLCCIRCRGHFCSMAFHSVFVEPYLVRTFPLSSRLGWPLAYIWLLYKSDAADGTPQVDLAGRGA